MNFPAVRETGILHLSNKMIKDVLTDISDSYQVDKSVATNSSCCYKKIF